MRDLSNTQKVLVNLLRRQESEEWVSRSSLRVPNVTSRLRDLRKSIHGSFDVEVRTAASLNRKGDAYTTFYRLAPTSVTTERVAFALRAGQ
jgi:hypothetical protein